MMVNTRDANLRVIGISFLLLVTLAAMRDESNKSGYAPLPTASHDALACIYALAVCRLQWLPNLPPEACILPIA